MNGSITMRGSSINGIYLCILSIERVDGSLIAKKNHILGLPFANITVKIDLTIIHRNGHNFAYYGFVI